MKINFTPSLDKNSTSLTVRSGTQSASWSPSGNASVTIVAERMPLETAPERLFFDVIVDGFETQGPNGSDYDPRFHELIYMWDFGDEGAQFDAPLHVLSEWKDANVAFGAFVAHVYAQPGTYTASVLVVEPSSGQSATASFEVVVKDPEETFSGTNTHYVSQTGDFSGAPAGSLHFDDLLTALKATDTAGLTPKRVMLKRGESWDWDVYWSSQRTGMFLHICASPGTGARPRLIDDPNRTKGAFFVHRNTVAGSEHTYSQLSLEGGWDSTTESGFNENYGVQIETGAMGHVLVDNCRITGCDQAVFETTTDQATQDEKSVAIFNSFLSDWRTIAHFAAGASRYAFLGAAYVCNPDALSGGPKDGFHNEHGCIRFQPRSTYKAFVDGCDFFNRVGWFQNITGFRTQQPCIRWNQSGTPNSVLNLQRSAFEGGLVSVALTSVNLDTVENVHNVLIDRCIFVGTHMTSSFITTDATAVTVRNCIGIIPDVPRVNAIYRPKAFVLANNNFNPDALAGALHIYHNTLINHMSDANSPSGDASVEMLSIDFTPGSLREENNIVHQPNLSAPDVVHGPLSTEILWTPREKGYISVDQPELLTQYATPLDTIQLPRPLETSSALGGGLTGMLSYRDIYGKLRPAYPSLGALEME